jgi:hypothetical protein
LLQCIAEGALRTGLDGKQYWEWNMGDHQVCFTAVLKLFGCSNYKMRNACRHYAQEVHIHACTGMQLVTSNAWSIDWNFELDFYLNNFIRDMGDQIPNEATIHLPCYLKPLDLWNDFAMQHQDNNKELTLQVLNLQQNM